MGLQTVSDKLFEYLISNVSGERFESIAKKLFSAAYGDEYVPLGGMHDGGADGYYLSHVYAVKKPNTFFQFSVTDSKLAKDKVVRTIESLRKVERTPKQIIYSTTQNLPKQDILKEHIFNQYDILLVIYDRDRLKQLVNSDANANKLFLEFFAPDIDAVKNSAKSLHGAVNKFVQDPTVFALLDYELKDRFSKDQLKDRILDSLIYWALRDTDPDSGKFLRREEIAQKISTVFPTATSVLAPTLDARLIELSRKVVGGAERVRYHKRQDWFCLPFEMRRQLAERAIEESKLQEDFMDSIKERLKSIAKKALTDDVVNLGAELDI